MSYMELFVLGTGIFWGMLYYHKTGWSCGGIITPGLIAVNIAYPGAIIFSFLSAVIISLVLEIIVRLYSLYGRQRIALAMLLALLFRIGTLRLFPFTSLWIGWVIPALIASDIQKQGLFRTLSGTLSISMVSLMSVELVRNFIMVF